MQPDKNHKKQITLIFKGLVFYQVNYTVLFPKQNIAIESHK